MSPSLLSPASFRRFLVALAATASLLYGMVPSAAQRSQKPRPRYPVLPITPAHPPKAGSPMLAPRNGPSPSSLLNSSSWTPIGPAALNNNGFNSTSADLVSGRVSGIAVDPTDPKTIYEAASGGGVWKTTDGGTTWRPLTDSQPDLAMGAIAVAPSNHLKVYAGTGEANNSGDSNHGVGILVSNNGGATWSLNTANGALDGTAIGQIAVDSTNANIAYAAVGSDYSVNGLLYANEGIYKTTDGGTTWTNMTAAVSLPESTDPATVDWSAVVVDPNTPAIVYAAIGDYYGGVGNGIFRSTDGGTTWDMLSNAPNGGDSALGRIALAVSPAASTTGNHVLYVVASDTLSYGLGYFLRSDNADASSPNFTDLTSTTPDFLGAENNPGQGWYDIAIGVDANGIVYCAGVENYNTGGTQAIITSPDLGVTWTDISIVNNFEPHTDNHAIAFDSNNRMLAGNDGGIFRFDPSGPGWTDLNGNLNTIQFQGIGLHPTLVGTVVGGSQDNGTELFADNLLWNQVAAGDGGPAKISQSNPSVCYHEYTNGAIERSDDGCMTWTPIYSGLSGNVVNFYTPYTLDPTNGDHLLFGTDYVNETTNGGATWTAIGSPGTNSFNTNDAAVDTVAIAPANGHNPEAVYAATGGQFASSSWIFVAQNPSGTSTQWAEVDLPSCTVNATDGIGCRVNQIVTDPNDPTGGTAFAVANTFSAGGNHVFMTTDFGTDWTDISANLPNVPVWSIQIDIDTNHTAYIATDAGVYSSHSPYSAWTLFGTGLPNAQGYDLELNSNLHVLAVGTHGRGAWEILTQSAQQTLTVTKAGVGTGTVTSSPSGIDCGSTCSADFPASTPVTLTATAGSDSAIGGWTGCDSVSSAGDACTVTMSAAKAVTVSFIGIPTLVPPTARAITYGQMLSSSTLTGGSAKFNSTSVPGSFAFDSPNTVPTAGVQSEAITFTPTDTTTYAPAHATVNVTVDQAVPVITWAAPAAITYGTALSSAQLDASASVPGTFTYTPTTGTVVGAGSQTLKVTFTPTDSTNYASNTKTAQLTVNSAPLAVKANNQSMTYGSTVPTLTGTVTAVVAGDGITATFTTTATSNSTVGQYPIMAILNDPNSKLANYSVTNTPGTLTISQATPVVTWSAPASIVYGTPLGSAQLNATSSVPGAFVYSPAAGTVLGAGTQTLKATFTATDNVDYVAVQTSVTLMVNQATPAIAVSSSQNPAQVSQPVTFTAAVTSPAGTPTGVVTFWDGTTQLGTGTLTAGMATYATSSLALGTHSITAQYSGDANFIGVTSAPLTQTETSFSIGLAPGASSSATSPPGGLAIYMLQVTPPGSSPVSFSVAGLPKGFTYSFNPNTVPAGAGPTDLVLTVTIPSQVAAAAVPAQPASTGRTPLILGLLVLPLLGLRKSMRRFRRLLLIALVAIGGLAATATLSGCSHRFNGFNSGNSNPPPPGSYTLTVTATAGGQTQSTTLTLNVR